MTAERLPAGLVANGSPADRRPGGMTGSRRLLADDPPGTWQTVQRLSALGYDWHNIMHMIAAVVSDDLYRAVQEHRQFDPGDYARRLNELPGDNACPGFVERQLIAARCVIWPSPDGCSWLPLAISCGIRCHPCGLSARGRRSPFSGLVQDWLHVEYRRFV